MADRRRVDLRSDTVTQPTEEMRAAMAAAVVGDDVFREDPTVRDLEERTAGLCGTESALFVPSGTMANLIAVMVHVSRGGEVIADEESHLVLNEGGGASTLASASVRTLRSDAQARFSRISLAHALRDPDNEHHPRSALLMLENTHAHRMGMPLEPPYLRRIAAWAHPAGLAVHVDGARLANASIALGVPIAELLADVDSGSICLSKGLGCPAGSLVVGSAAFIAEARRARKSLGGGQRQIGILAAAGLVALRDREEGMIERLVEDHRRARVLADALVAIPGVRLQPSQVRTNIVIFKLSSGSRPRDAFVAALGRRGVLMMAYPRGRIRAVTHAGISDADIVQAADSVAAALREIQPSSVQPRNAPQAP